MAWPAAPLLLLALHVVGVWSMCSNKSLVSAGLDTLLAEYERAAPPESQVVVHLALDVRHAAVDERASTVRLLADLHMTWRDMRIRWNATEWDCDALQVPAERLWLPDVELLNGAAGAGGGEGSLHARVAADALVSWITRLDVAVPVAIDLADWPKDLQVTEFKFGSREHPVQEIDLNITDFSYAIVWEVGNWEIVSVRGHDTTVGAADTAKRLAVWNVALRRRAAAHALASATVFAAAVLLLAASAVLPPMERPALCACAAFTASLWLISALLRLPGSSTYPRALSLMAGVCGGAGAWCACAALVALVARCARAPPPQLRALLAAAPACCAAAAPTLQEPESVSAVWAAAAQLLDNLLRVALALVLLVLVCLWL